MPTITIPIAFLSLVFSSGQRGGVNSQPLEQGMPTTLSEAHAELERILSAEDLAKIDAMPSEEGMIHEYHMGLGGWIRGRWGLWRGSALAKHMEELGFTHPDDMSGVILETFWCKRHGRDFRLEERADEYKEYYDARQAEQDRAREAEATMRGMMMGLRFEKREVPVVQIPARTGKSVRFLCRFRGGVFLTLYFQGRISRERSAAMGGFYVDSDGEIHTKPEYDDLVTRGFYAKPVDDTMGKMKPGDDFYTPPFYLHPTDGKIHRIHVDGTDEVYTAVVAGGTAWFAGLASGKPVLVGIGDGDRITLPLPQEDEMPDLGLDGQTLLAVYSKTIFRLSGREWTVLHSGDILLPRSGLPVERHGNRVFFRDEGRAENRKRLWWLSMGEPLHLSVLDHDVGVVTEEGPFWDNCFSYCVMPNGDLWACVGDDSKSLLRRSKDGNYTIAIMNGSVRFEDAPLSSRQPDEVLSISAVESLPHDTLLLVGDRGLYRLNGNELIQQLAFVPEGKSRRRTIRNWTWDPSCVLMLDNESYIIGTSSWHGVHLLNQDSSGEWRFSPLHVDIETAVTW